jgi:hypothetical protein
MSTQLVRYDAMCQAIAEARDLDEVKDIRDKALALELYAQQAKNEENERWCREIRERAETSWGEIYADSEKAKGKAGPGRGKAGHNAGPAFNEAPTLRALGVNKNQSAEWQARAVLVARPEVLPPRVSMHDVHARLVAIEILLAQLLERLDR